MHVCVNACIYAIHVYVYVYKRISCSYVHMYVCMHACMWKFAGHTRMHVCIHACMYILTYVRKLLVCACICMHACKYVACMHACSNARKLFSVYMHACMHACMYIRTYVYMRMHSSSLCKEDACMITLHCLHQIFVLDHSQAQLMQLQGMFDIVCICVPLSYFVSWPWPSALEAVSKHVGVASKYVLCVCRKHIVNIPHASVHDRSRAPSQQLQNMKPRYCKGLASLPAVSYSSWLGHDRIEQKLAPTIKQGRLLVDALRQKWS